MSDNVSCRFAHILISAFRTAGETRQIYYDEATSKLLLKGKDRAFWIGNLFKESVRCKAESGEPFLSSAWKIWSMVQDDLPAPSKWVPEILRPFRDETHPLSYRVEEVPDTDLWAVQSPFDEQFATEGFDLVGAYHVWWSNQFQRACKKHLYNIYRWLTSGQLNEAALCVLSDLRRLWRQGRLRTMSNDFRLGDELAFLGAEPEVPPVLREFLDKLRHDLGSFERAAQVFRHLRTHDS